MIELKDIQSQIKSAQRYSGRLSRQVTKIEQCMMDSKRPQDRFNFLVLLFEQFATAIDSAQLVMGLTQSIIEQLTTLQNSVHQDIRDYVLDEPNPNIERR